MHTCTCKCVVNISLLMYTYVDTYVLTLSKHSLISSSIFFMSSLSEIISWVSAIADNRTGSKASGGPDLKRKCFHAWEDWFQYW